jgi:hypothetical protein
MVYNASIPNPTDLISNSQSALKENFSQLNTQFAIDHTAFDAISNNGFHNKVTIPTVLALDPTVVAPAGVFYTKSVSGTTQAFFSNGTPIQLTGAALPFSATANGYITLAGGIIMKWGIGSAGNSPVGNTFPIAFPTACWSVTIAPIVGAGREVGVSSVTASGFSAASTSLCSIYYIAIGN